MLDKKGDDRNGMDCLPGVKIHEQHQRLHGDHVDPSTVESCHFQHFQVRHTQHDQREKECERVQGHRENDELRPASLGPDVAEGARCVKAMVPDPGAPGGHRREAKRVDPRVGQRRHRVPVPYSRVVVQGEYHRHPSVDAESRHAQHGVGGDKSVEESHELAEAAAFGVARGDEADQGEWHVRHTQQQVAKRQVENEKTGYLFADLRIVEKADQHHNVGQQRHDDNPQNYNGSYYVQCVHGASPEISWLLLSASVLILTVIVSCCHSVRESKTWACLMSPNVNKRITSSIFQDEVAANSWRRNAHLVIMRTLYIHFHGKRVTTGCFFSPVRHCGSLQTPFLSLVRLLYGFLDAQLRIDTLFWKGHERA